ncbi:MULTISPECIES: DUF551 domain-containing protein [Klebsiella pneumoniae complex]|uniref:DUF551 domain-containing protein n=1 Tax=Klebsiella pneumoniae complex TaxID=3390273 RepID=UPI001256B2ED|nr:MULTISPECIES: DUF551 domain-containing protein [Klebsiella]GKM82399.1 hypothetical protein NUKP68_39010 [Klebsiella variicola]VAS23664.1 Eaa1 [Klebsiella variicola]
MTNNQLTNERIEKMALETIDTISTRLVETTSEDGGSIEVRASLFLNLLRELQERRKAETDSEPVAWDYEWASYITCEGPQDFKRIIEREAPPEWAIEEGQARNIIPLYRHAQPAPVVQCPFPCGWDNLNKLAIQDAAFIACGLVEGEPITEAHRQAAISNNDRLLKVISACRAAMLQAGNSPVIPDTWIPVSEQVPEECGRYWCYVEEQTDLGKSHYQWNCSWNGERWWVEGEDGGIVTHWMPLPSAPQEVKGE